MSETALQTIDEGPFEALADPIIERADSLVVTNQDEFAAAAAFLQEVKRALHDIAEECDPICKSANDLHKKLTGQRSKLKAPLLGVETIIKNKCADFIEEEDRKRAAEVKAQELEAARQREVDAARERETARKLKADEDARLAIAQEHFDAGQEEEAELVLDMPALPTPERKPAPPPPPVRAKVQPVKGITSSKPWAGEVVDADALILAIVAGKAPRDWLSIDQAKIDRAVKAMGGQLNVPGVRCYRKTQIAGKR